MIPKHGSLKEWAERGVLMLNATYVEKNYYVKNFFLLNSMTVDQGDANSHSKFGWQDFTTEVMKYVLFSFLCYATFPIRS